MRGVQIEIRRYSYGRKKKNYENLGRALKEERGVILALREKYTKM